MSRLLKRTGLVFFVASVFLSGCGEKEILQTGVWRGVFWVGDEPVPINFVVDGKREQTTFVFLSGSRRDTFQVEFVGRDSLHIAPKTFDYQLFAKIEESGALSGEYRNLAPGNTSRILRFEGEYGKDYRFAEPGSGVKPVSDLTGKWSLTIAGREGAAANRVAVFSQDQDKLEGVVLAITGDTGELDGNISGDTFRLSGFSGSGVTLVQGKIDNEGRLSGTIGFGEKALHFTGERNENAALADAYQLTHLKPGYRRLDLALPDLNGDTISLADEKYRGKVVVIDILGSWCPNCIDQIAFLSPWYEKNKHRGVEVIGVAFEVKDDLVYARRVLERVIDRFDIKYDILFGGKPDPENVQARFEALNTFLAFPTTIILGKDGTVKAIHTGFSGKGTGGYYEEFVEKWDRDMDRWLAE